MMTKGVPQSGAVHVWNEGLVLVSDGKMFHNITDLLQKALMQYGGSFGVLTVSSLHTTAMIKILEDEILSLNDIMDHLEKVAPRDGKYAHDKITLRNVPSTERVNGVAHVRSLYFPHSEHVHVADGQLILGEWQQVFLVDLDGPRTREVLLTFVGI